MSEAFILTKKDKDLNFNIQIISVLLGYLKIVN